MAYKAACSSPYNHLSQTSPDFSRLKAVSVRASIETQCLDSSPPSLTTSEPRSSSKRKLTSKGFSTRRSPQELLNVARRKLRLILPATHALHTRICHATGALHPLQPDGKPEPAFPTWELADSKTPADSNTLAAFTNPRDSSSSTDSNPPTGSINSADSTPPTNSTTPTESTVPADSSIPAASTVPTAPTTLAESNNTAEPSTLEATTSPPLNVQPRNNPSASATKATTPRRPRKCRKDISDPDYALERSRLIHMWNHDWERDEDWDEWYKCEDKMVRLKRKFKLAEVVSKEEDNRERPKMKKRKMEKDVVEMERGYEARKMEQMKKEGVDWELAKMAEQVLGAKGFKLPTSPATAVPASTVGFLESAEQYTGDYNGNCSSGYFSEWTKTIGIDRSSRIPCLARTDGADDAKVEEESVVWERAIDPQLLVI